MTDDDRRAPATPAPDKPASPDYSVEMSPRQLAGGFAIVAALLVLFVRSRRRRGAKGDTKSDG
jgi:hypothetical protein